MINKIALYVVVFSGVGVIGYVGILVWWKVLDGLMKLFKFKKDFLRWIIERQKVKP